jgi:hypothetical protein
MAVEEQEYFTFSAGNGLAPVTRPQAAAGKAKGKAKPEARSSGGIKPFLQGITLGTVLLIPAGVWFWVRMAPDQTVSAAEETAPAHPAAKGSKSATGYGYRRKPLKAVLPAAKVKTEESNRQPGSLVVTEPPPAVVSTPIPAASPLVQVPKIPEDSESLVPERPKKNIWHKLAAPFRGKNSGTTNDPPAPDGQ